MIQAPVQDVFCLITEFLASDPTDEELLAFMLPDDMQARVSYLLVQNREAELTCEERHELDDYVRADHMISRMKTKTRLRQKGLA